MSYLRNRSRIQRTSLTKHGSYKIASLLRTISHDQILDHISGSIDGINIDAGQAAKNLSAYDGKVPEFWRQVVQLGDSAINAAVFLAIVLSHDELIKVMEEAKKIAPGVGVIARTAFSNSNVPNSKVKSYTNFNDALTQLGFKQSDTYDDFTFNITNIFDIEGFSEIAYEVIKTKLIHAGHPPDEELNSAIKKELLHTVFGVEEEFFLSWLFGKNFQLDVIKERISDIKFLLSDSELTTSRPFSFKPGHKNKNTGTLDVTRTAESYSASLRHNEIQNALYEALCNKYGTENVSTEQDTGQWTQIDIAVRINGSSYIFYEIKTALTVRLCIRQALPQLLEYAYWSKTGPNIAKLIIVGEADSNEEAEDYLERLRNKHGIPIYYQKYEEGAV